MCGKREVEWMFILFSFLLIFILIVLKFFSRVQVYCWRVTQNLKIIFLRHHLRHLQTQHISVYYYSKWYIYSRKKWVDYCNCCEVTRPAVQCHSSALRWRNREEMKYIKIKMMKLINITLCKVQKHSCKMRFLFLINRKMHLQLHKIRRTNADDVRLEEKN